jgi:CHAD domain-containing protein
MPSIEAMKIILLNLLNIVQRNEDGIKKEIDVEFLHDYRIAVRRTRSAITQIKGVLPDDMITEYKEQFSNIGTATNHARDLDVYLMRKHYFLDILPMEIRPGLEYLFDHFYREKKKEYRKLRRLLNSDEYKETIIGWENSLKNLNDEKKNQAVNSKIPVLQLAKKIIYRKYKQVLAQGIKINKETPDEELHKLRIECKKLRYLIEFFQSLFPEKEISLFINHLKILQTHLGDFNDYFVQQENLNAFLQNLDPSNEKLKNISAAVGGVIGGLYQGQQFERKSFEQIFKDFSKKSHQNLAKKLFG